MMVATTTSSIPELPNSTGTALTPTNVAPVGSVALTRESPNPELKSPPLHLPFSYYLRMAAEKRILQQALMNIANQRMKKRG